MRDYMNPARRTGRTTRELTRALLVAATGRRVVYVVHNHSMKWYAEDMARMICGHTRVPSTFEVVSAAVYERRRIGAEDLHVAFDHVAAGGP
jgi:hypothetical protein